MSDEPRWVSHRVVAKTRPGIVSMVETVAWHDSVVHRIEFVRRDSADQVVLLADLLYDWETQASCRVRWVLRDVRRVVMDAQWGVACISDGEMLESLELAWEGAFLDAVLLRPPHGDVAHLRLSFASTGSTLDIAALGMSIEPLLEP